MKTPTQVNEVAIVLPAYNEEKDLPCLLENIRTTLADMPFKYTVVVVDDGSKDRTAEIAREAAKSCR
jgi:dolichol-phosphate mannosyltransferase